ncbi:Dehydrogenase FUM7 [Fusarium oxysporum f. sp. albedinis]|nr:Dehydrogenase FUM7 [Fusarium oxysporum f. sp. albedinis]
MAAAVFAARAPLFFKAVNRRTGPVPVSICGIVCSAIGPSLILCRRRGRKLYCNTALALVEFGKKLYQRWKLRWDPSNFRRTGTYPPISRQARPQAPVSLWNLSYIITS